MWLIQRVAPPGSTELPPVEGPFSRADVVAKWAHGYFADGSMVFTDERIFPNPERNWRKKKVQKNEWMRWDQLPSPVRQALESEGREILEQRLRNEEAQRLAQEEAKRQHDDLDLGAFNPANY